MKKTTMVKVDGYLYAFVIGNTFYGAKKNHVYVIIDLL